MVTEEQKQYAKELIEDTKEAGKMKPELTLKIIVSTIMRKFNCSQDEAIKICQEVM